MGKLKPGAAPAAVQASEVVLVSMPFAPLFWPSIGLSLLKAGLLRDGVSATVVYFTLAFAERVGANFYNRIGDGKKPPSTDLVGEWIFAAGLDRARRPEVAAYVDEVLKRRTREHRPASDAFVRRVVALREEVPAFLDRAADEVLARRPRLVGFSSVFQQQAASLGLARRLKERAPDTFIVFGGANCEGVMGSEIARQYPFVDAVVSGEGDVVFPQLVARVLHGKSPADLPGVRTRETVAACFARGEHASAAAVMDLDALPAPDYGDFFARFATTRFRHTWQPGVFFETSRGCWWGERQHCTFCGLNGATMAYRSKSAARAVDELSTLAGAHPEAPVAVVDNILDLGYFKDFLPALAARGGFDLFYETKSNLKKAQVRLLSAAGVTTIQPGIESLSDEVLALMRKGVSAAHNLQLLKWSKELGVAPLWNFLWGFPGERPEEYARMAALVPLLSHLPPPVAGSSVRLDRFSPNFFDAERLGFTDVVPFPSYAHVYGLDAAAVANLAYHFNFAYREERDVAKYTALLARRLAAWRREHAESDLFSVDLGTHLLLWDLRPCAHKLLSVLTGKARRAYLACDAALGWDALRAALGGACVEGELHDLVGPLVEDGLLYAHAGRHLSLAVALGDYAPGPPVVARLRQGLKSVAKRVDGRYVLPLAADATPRSARAMRREGRRGERGRGRLDASCFYRDGKGNLVVEV